MEIGTALAGLILEDLAKQGLAVKPFSTDPTGGKGYNCSAFARSGEPVELTINGETGQYRPTINVNVNFHRVKAAAAPQGAKLNTLPASLGRVAELVDKLKAGK